MLMNLNRPAWAAGLQMGRFEDEEEHSRQLVKGMVPLLETYAKDVTVREEDMTEGDIAVAKAGKVDAKKELEASVHDLLSHNVVQCMGAMLSTVVF